MKTISKLGISQIDRKLRVRKILAPMPSCDQWEWLRNFILRGLKRTDMANFGYQDRRAILCSLDRLDQFLMSRFGNRYDNPLKSEAKLYASDSSNQTTNQRK